MKHFQLIREGIDVVPVLAELAAHPQFWNEHTARKTAPGGPHAEADDVWVRFNDVAPFEAGTRPWSEFSAEHLPINYPAWDALPSLHPIVFDLMREAEGEVLGGILITRISAGGKVGWHTDASWAVSYYEKFYLALQNEPGSKFFTTDEVLEPGPGSVWLFDNRKPHAVKNMSDTDRITCVICIRTGKFGRYREER